MVETCWLTHFSWWNHYCSRGTAGQQTAGDPLVSLRVHEPSRTRCAPVHWLTQQPNHEALFLLVLFKRWNLSFLRKLLEKDKGPGQVGGILYCWTSDASWSRHPSSDHDGNGWAQEVYGGVEFNLKGTYCDPDAGCNRMFITFYKHMGW